MRALSEAPNATIVLDEAGNQHTILEKALFDIASTLATSLDPNRLFRRLATLALQTTGAERCGIFTFDATSRLVPIAAVARVGDPVAGEQFLNTEPIEIVGYPERLTAWRDAVPLVIGDAELSTLLPENWKQFGSRSVALATIRTSEERFGVIAVDYTSRRHAFSTTEIRLLDLIASSAGAALRNAHLFQRLRGTLDRQQRLLHNTLSIRSGKTLAELVAIALDGFCNLLDVETGAISLVNAGKDGYHVAASRGAFPAELPIDDVRQAEVDSALPLSSEDLHRLGIGAEGLRTGLLIPLAEDDEVLGAVLLASQERHPWPDDVVNLVEIFGKHVASAIQAAQLRQALSAKVKAVDALRRLSDAVIGKTDLRAAIGLLNRTSLLSMGLQCESVTFADRALCSILNLAEPTPEEASILRAWRRADEQTAPIQAAEGGALLVQIHLQGRLAGLLRLRTSFQELDAGEQEFLLTFADGLGDIALKAKLRRQSEHQVQQLAVARDRDRIARDLHDTVGQLLYGLCLKTEHCLSLDPAKPQHQEQLVAQLQDIRVRASGGISDVRAAVYSLAFLHVRSAGLVASLRKLCDEFARSTGIDARLRLNTGGRRRRFDEEVESALYRVAHEALINVERHSRASGVVISIEVAQHYVELTIMDDGVGLDQRTVPDWRSSGHFGLRMMARSITEMGGQFSVEPMEPRGLAIRARLSLRRPARRRQD